MIKVKDFYYYSLLILAISLPFSHLYTSLAEFLLFGVWAFDKNIGYKLRKFFSRKSVFIFSLLFFVHIIWLFNTNNFDYALKDIRVKIPLLLFPLIIGTSEIISFDKIKKIIIAFSVSIFITTIISLIVYFKGDFVDIRKISVFISHIRLSLYIDLSVLSLIYLLYKNKITKYKLPIVLLIIWFVFFLILLQAFTGLIVLVVLFYILLIVSAIKIKNVIYRLFSVFVLVSLPVVLFFYIKNVVDNFYDYHYDKNNLDKYTVNGNPYWFNYKSKIVENGNFVNYYVCDKELKKEWNRVSKIKIDGFDKKNQRIKYTLKRYLTSKGYRKDSVGISKLTKHDIQLIEDGCANYIYDDKFGIYSRIYKIIWQIDVFNKRGYFEGHSITQRLFYLKTGLHLLKNNFWFGTGTGDINDEFMQYYAKLKPKIEKKFMRRTHNQFFTFLITFGIFGLALIITAIFYPIFYEKKQNSFLFLTFMIIILLSVINEDTFETQAGVTFFSYFYSLFLFSKTE